MGRAKTTNSEARINIRIDSGVKKNAEYIFDRLGLNLSDGINIYLRRVVADNGVPFPLKLARSETIGTDAAAMEAAFAGAVGRAIERKQSKGLPVARYDSGKNRAYMEYADGRKEYID